MEGREEGLAEGLAKGELKGRSEVARSLVTMGLPMGQILEATKLTEEQVRALVQLNE